ncbi:MAG: LysM domain-containing protein [Candidatus Gastranaerophilales bacterium]|nr:LysM domain-containing protein [Candidatus Gastranaerophilales bacterium]
MRSSTLHKSSISRERIAALEELLSDKATTYDSSPGVYVRSDKDRELDILWQGFKVNCREERSPGVYLTIGFITGAICMFLMTTILNFGNTSHETFADLNLWKKANTEAAEVKIKAAPIGLTPPAQTVTVAGKSEKYSIQSGDTLEKVALRFYGTSDPVKIKQIQDANNLENPDRISIGQELTVPMGN